MFSLNKTGDWLSSLSTEEREKFLDQSRKEGREARQKYKERLSEIQGRRIETLKEKRKQIEKKEADQFK
jgi:DNA anti-recombination protein RmuC